MGFEPATFRIPHRVFTVYSLQFIHLCELYDKEIWNKLSLVSEKTGLRWLISFSEIVLDQSNFVGLNPVSGASVS